MKQCDVLVVNPAGYRGTPRRGPYELTGFKQQCEAIGLKTLFVDFQAEVGAGRMPFPNGHIDAIGEQLRKYKARCILTTMRTTAGPWVLEMARLAKELHPDCKVAVYAPRIESRVQRVLERHDSVLDLLIATGNEGRAAVLLEGLLSPRAQHSVLRYRPTTEAATPSLFELGQPWFSPDRTIAAIQVGRGCPERCTFCAAHIGRGATPAYAQADAIVAAAAEAFDRLDAQRRLFVMLETENLVSEKKLIAQIFEHRRRASATFLWGAYGRIDDVDASTESLLWEAGCRFLFFGIETASSRLLKVLGKQFDVAIAVPRIRSLNNRGIRTQCSFMFALPGETEAEFVSTAELMANVAWAGSFVDWTPMRIEADSAMERIVQRMPRRVLRESELYLDMTEAGLNVDFFDADAAYRVYGVEMADIDVDLACILAKRWRRILTEAPLTTYILSKGLGMSIRQMLTDQRYVQRPISAMWMDAGEASSFVEQFYNDEVAHNTMDYDEHGESSSFGLIYEDLRRDPELIPRIFALEWWKRAGA